MTYVGAVRVVGCMIPLVFFFQAEDGIRDLVRSRGLGDVYKRQGHGRIQVIRRWGFFDCRSRQGRFGCGRQHGLFRRCLLYTSDAADERSSVDLGGRRIIKKKNSAVHVAERIVA